MNIEKELTDLLEETGMLESRARCELAAKELAAKGVRIGESIPQSRLTESQPPLGKGAVEQDTTCERLCREVLEVMERESDVRTMRGMDRLRELERFLFAPTEAVELAVTAFYELLRERAYLIECLQHTDTNCDYCDNNPPEDCFCECEACDLNCPCKFCTRDGERFTFRGVPKDWRPT